MKINGHAFSMKWILTLLTLSLAIGCAKDRPEEFAQGEDYELMQISEFQGKSFEVETGEALSSNKLSNASTSSFSTELEDVRDLDFVTLVNPHELIRDVPFRGRPHHKYTMEIELYDDYLIVYKTATKKDLPTVELTYAEPHPIKSDYYRVVMVGYPVSLAGVENKKDESGENTHKLSTFERSKLSQASHFKYNLSERILFEAAEKYNTFSKEMFNGDWFYANTVVETAVNSDSRTGHQLSQLSRIKFIPEQDGIRAVNVSIDKEIEDDDYLNNETAFFIPGEWVDFQRGNTGSKKFTEEKIGDGNPNSRPWNERSNLQLKFEKVEGITDSNSETPIFDNLQLSKGYIGIIYTYKGSGLKIHLSMKSAHSPKLQAARVYPEKDWDRFGFFMTERNVLRNYTFEREQDFQKNLLLSRFMPNSDNKIIYHFSTISSKNPSIREVGRSAINSWNDSFKKAGTGIQVVLDESFDVDLGDIRYNILNLVDTKAGTSLLGYGPSVSDSESGEIVSATANVYTYPLRSGLYRTIRNYIRYKLGMIKEDASPFIESLGSVGTNAIGSSGLQSGSLLLRPSMSSKYHFSNQNSAEDKSDSSGKNHLFSLDTLPNGIKSLSSEEEKKTYLQLKNDYSGTKKTSELKREWLSKHAFYGGQCSFATEARDRIKDIEQECPQVVEYIELLKKKNSDKAVKDIMINTNEESQVLDACVEKLFVADTLGTLVHELGHNFGLAHNFIASTDEKNFLKDQHGNNLTQSSSVMDYIPGNHNELMAPGPYDIAAIKYGYAQKVELTNGKELDLSPYVRFGTETPYTLDQILQINKVEMRPYKYCADWRAEDVPAFLRIDPLCRRHDFGENPLEVAKRTEANFWSMYYVSFRRFDRYQEPSSEDFAFYAKEYAFFPMKEIYDQWRYYLKEIIPTEQDGKYLSDIDAEQMQKIIVAMKDQTFLNNFYRGNQEKIKLVQSYTQAAEYISDFLVRLIKTPSKTCRTISIDNAVSAPRFFDFERLRTDIFEKTGIDVKDCMDISTSQYLAELGYRPTEDFGESIDPVIRSKEIEDNIEIDAVGLGSARAFAMATLSARTPFLKQNLVEDFVPSLLDDPRIRDSVETFLVDRVINGLNNQTMFLENKSTDELTAGQSYLLFKAEAPLIESYFRNLIIGLNVPQDATTSETRKSKYGLLLGSNPKLLPGKIRPFAGGYAGIPEEATNAEAIMQAYEFIINNLGQPIEEPPVLLQVEDLKLLIESIGFYSTKDLVADGQPIKVSQLLDQAGKVSAAIKSIQDSYLQKLLSETYGSVYLQIVDLFAGKEVPEETKAQLLELDVEKFFRMMTKGEIGIELVAFDSMSQQLTIEQLAEDINQKAIGEYVRNIKLNEDSEEAKAQLDLITNILEMFYRNI